MRFWVSGQNNQVLGSGKLGLKTLVGVFHTRTSDSENATLGTLNEIIIFRLSHWTEANLEALLVNSTN